MIERGEGGISYKGITYKLIASPNTGRVLNTSLAIMLGLIYGV
jgi:hypothetical protein